MDKIDVGLICRVTLVSKRKGADSMKKKLKKMLGLGTILVIMANPGPVMADSIASITGNTEYDKMIEKYRKGVSEQWSVNEFIENDLCMLPGYGSDVNRVGYCLMDIDDNGTDELIMGSVYEDGTPGVIYDIYAMKEDSGILVARSGEHSMYSLCSDHIISYDSFGGPMSFACYFYTLNGEMLDLKEGVLYDGEYDETNPWFYITKDMEDEYSEPISEDTANTIQNSYERIEIPFVPLSTLENG